MSNCNFINCNVKKFNFVLEIRGILNYEIVENIFF